MRSKHVPPAKAISMSKRAWIFCIGAALGSALWVGSEYGTKLRAKAVSEQRQPMGREPIVRVETYAAAVAASHVAGKTAVESNEPDRNVILNGRSEVPHVHSTPIDVSPGFELLLAPVVEPSDINPASIAVRQHRRLIAEERDAAWAARVEPRIRSYIEDALTAQGLNPQRIEPAVIECRMTACELQLIGPDEDNLNPARDPQDLIPRMVRGPLFADFDSQDLSMRMFALPDGRIGYLAFLPRKRF